MLPVRWAVAADLPSVVALEEQIFPDPWCEAALADAIAGRNMLVAGKSGSPVRGYLVFSCVGPHLHLENLAVARSWRRRGLGRRLLESGLEVGRAAALVTATLEVQASNFGARALYTAAGFTATGRLPGYYRVNAAGLRADAIVYQRDLRLGPTPDSSQAQGDLKS